MIAGKKVEIGIAVLNAKGQLIGINDVGFVHLPNGQRYTIAVFVKDSEESASSTAQIISDISQVIYQYVEQGD